MLDSVFRKADCFSNKVRRIVYRLYREKIPESFFAVEKSLEAVSVMIKFIKKFICQRRTDKLPEIFFVGKCVRKYEEGRFFASDTCKVRNGNAAYVENFRITQKHCHCLFVIAQFAVCVKVDNDFTFRQFFYFFLECIIHSAYDCVRRIYFVHDEDKRFVVFF